MSSSSLSPGTYLSSQYRSLTRVVAAPLNWDSLTTDRGIPDASANRPSHIVTSKLPAKHWKDGQIVGTQFSGGDDSDEESDPREGSSNAMEASKDVEVLDSLRVSRRSRLNFDGENRSPFRRAKVSGIVETDLQYYKRLSFRFNSIEGMDQASPTTPNGSVAFDKTSGALWYRRSKEAKWERAVFHHWIRDEISEVENGKGEDVENFEYGLLNGDITCMSSFERRPLNRAQRDFAVGNLRYAGRLVIDYTHSPVRAFREFPLVLSSQYAGAAMLDAQFQNSGIKYSDFWARMPPVIQERVEGRLILKPLYSIRAIDERVRQFRETSGLFMMASPIFRRDDGAEKGTARQTILEHSGDLEQAERVMIRQNRRFSRAAPPKFLPQDREDSRNLSPMTAHEALALWEALHATADHFEQLTGREPLRNEERPAPDYCAQWMDMQNQLRQIWDQTPPAPSLVSRGRWTGGIANWESGQLSVRA